VRRTLAGDWYDGEIPDNVQLDEGSLVETTHSFSLFRSRLPCGLHLGHGASAYGGTVFDVGVEGSVEVGRYSMLNSVRIICEARIEIGDHALFSWNVVLMDSYREPLDPEQRRRYREEVAAGRPPSVRSAPRPIQIGANVWVGFGSCILPGVSIGEGSIVGARSVVRDPVPPYTIVGGNPARVIRAIDRSGSHVHQSHS
jgi:acetyltransferase-like isoleucine patch superfamily enzyme